MMHPGARILRFILLVFGAAIPNAMAQLAPPDLPEAVEFVADIPYATSPHPRQKLDLGFVKKGRPRPLLIWIHGGAYRTGDKAENHAIWGDLMRRGYAVATINYRLSGDAKWPAQITDCKAAIRFLRAHAEAYHLDPDRFAVWGSSAGGHLAALVGASGGEKSFEVGDHLDQSSGVSCAVDLFGPTDFETMPQFTSPDSPEALLWGRPTSEAVEIARTASPLTYLSRDTPPILIIHGDADGVVNVAQSRQFDAARKKAGAPGELVVLPGVGHSHVDVWVRKRDHILGFFEKHLQPKAPVP